MYEGNEFYKESICKICKTSKYSIFGKILVAIHWVVNILTILTPIIIILLASRPSKEVPITVAIVVLGLLVFMFAILFLIEELRWSQKSRYAEATKSLHLCIHIIRDIFFYLEDETIPDDDRCKDISLSLWALAKTFSLLKGVHCRACIKIIECVENGLHGNLSDEEKLNMLYVTTFRRDLNTERTQEYRLEGDSKENTLAGNTDFRKLFLREDNSERFWIHNDIWKDKKTYQNTRLAKLNDIKDLGYRSALVVPIRKTTQTKYSEQQYSHKQDILGFVCIDSMTRGIFNKRYDPEVVALFADALFVLMKLWYKKKER